MTNCTRSRSPPAAPTASSKHRANLHLQERVSQRTSQGNGQKLVSKSSVEPDHHSDTIIKHDIQAYFKHVYVRESQLNSARQQCWLDWSVCVCVCVFILTCTTECAAGVVAALGLIGNFPRSTVEMKVGGDPAWLNSHQVTSNTCTLQKAIINITSTTAWKLKRNTTFHFS